MASDRTVVTALLDEAAAGIAVVSSDGAATLNSAARRLLGRAALGVADLPGAALARAALDGQTTDAAVVEVRRGDAEVALLVSWAPLREAGRVTAALGVFQDATALARRERELHEMLSHLAHELRTPLTPILGWARMLLVQKQPVQATLHRAAEVIERNVRLEVRLVDELLDLSRLQRGVLQLERRTVDVRDACRSAVEEVRGLLASRGLTLAERHAEEPLWVDGDPARLRQLLTALLDASIKLAGDGGRVEVATARTDTHVMATVAQAGGPACARRPETGLAIGLAVAGQLAERHGGRLETETAAADGGTCFALHLPYRAPAAQDTVP